MSIPICIHGGNGWFRALTKIFPSPVAGSGETPEEAKASLVETIKLNCWFYKGELLHKRIVDPKLEETCNGIDANWTNLADILIEY